MAAQTVRYLVFDVESVADGELISRVRYPGENLCAAEAIRRYRDELLQKHNSDFIPYTYQIPASVAVAKVAGDGRLVDLVTLDHPNYRPHVMTQHFWTGWKGYGHPTLVTFNGRTFDLPLLELAAFRYGVGVPDWFCSTVKKSWDQPRNRYNTDAHFDLQDLLVNFGATRFHGGLNLAANVLGKPGKMDVQGDMVQDMYDEGRLEEINDYCRCDVLDTYFVFLRSMVLTGQMSLDDEQVIVAETKEWIEERASESPAYQAYREGWGEWQNPWLQEAVAE